MINSTAIATAESTTTKLSSTSKLEGKAPAFLGTFPSHFAALAALSPAWTSLPIRRVASVRCTGRTILVSSMGGH